MQSVNTEPRKADPEETMLTRPNSAGNQESRAVAFGGISLDRKQMEEERLGRVKRKATGGLDSDRPLQKSKTMPRESQATLPKSTHSHATPIASSLEFPEATIKRTWARGYERDTSDIKIEEVFRKDDLELAVLSSFSWDEEWLIRKIDMSRTKVLLITYAASEEQVITR